MMRKQKKQQINKQLLFISVSYSCDALMIFDVCVSTVKCAYDTRYCTQFVFTLSTTATIHNGYTLKLSMHQTKLSICLRTKRETVKELFIAFFLSLCAFVCVCILFIKPNATQRTIKCL